ncbi:ACP S-malonyltransferase [Paenibacillus daejeonensis]|uniref:ACP S-malonyltransferase n=1 Tax=Paenibacillus daejeonensis TaxID=135193 RepID=UPI000369717F|nr:ACP S-malonyltransferase [Paenibacillus daejeonensis]
MSKFAFIFPGQSSQRKGMLLELYQESNTVRQTFTEASEILGYNIADICFNDDTGRLMDIAVSAPVILTAGVATYRHIHRHYSMKPMIAAGHSLGEYTALTCAGMLAFEQALPLVTYRSELAKRVMAEHSGVMSVIFKISESEVEGLCKQMRRSGAQVWISCYNSDQQVCVAGRERDVATLEKQAKRLGASYKRLDGNAPYHTPLMRDAVEELRGFLQGCTITTPRYPVVSNVSTQPYTEFSTIENLLLQLQHPVKWHHTIQYITKQNTDTFVELGSGQILTRLLGSTAPDVQAFSYETSVSRAGLPAPVRELEGAGV